MSSESTVDGFALQLLERSPNGVIATGPDGLLAVVNPAVRALLPVVPDAVGRRPIEAIPVLTLQDALDPSRKDELEFALETGRRNILVHAVSLDDGGRLAILQDVTRLKQAESYRREFVANVSHELRTPATAIAGYAETLLDDRDTLDPYVVEMVEVIHRNALRLNALFEDLLHLARLDAQEGPLALEDLQLLPIVAETIEKLVPVASDRNLTFQVLVPREVSALANREALAHVVSNLVGNAVKYSNDGGLITVQVREREGRIALEVIDVGIGIAPEHLERIFERFYRTDKGRSRDAGGTGLGLAICKRLCDMMGAPIDVKSRPGRGSVFRVNLQRAGGGEQA